MKYVYLFHSEPVDKTAPVVHTSPAAKTFSKSAPAPRNGNVVPASTFKSPAAQNKPSFQPSGPSGRVTYAAQNILTLPLLFIATWMVVVLLKLCVVASFYL